MDGSEILLIESPIGLLALPMQVAVEAREKAVHLGFDTERQKTALISAGEPLLVKAEEMARLTQTTAAWWEAAARKGDVPFIYVGKHLRFDPQKALQWLDSVQERDASGRVRRCAFTPRAND